MSRTAKILAILVGAALVLVMGTGIMVAGTVVTSGLATVSIHEEGPDGLDLYIPVPAGLIEASLSVAPVVLRLLPDDHLASELDRVRADLDHMLPALEAVLAELGNLPDAVLVEVEGESEYVRVSKQGGSIRVVVEEGGDRVVVSIPTRVFRQVGGLLNLS